MSQYLHGVKTDPECNVFVFLMSEAVTILPRPSLPVSKVTAVTVVTAPPEPCAGLPWQAHVLVAGPVLAAVLVSHTHRVEGEISQTNTGVAALNLEDW